MVQCIVVGIAQGNGVVVVVAIHKGHDARAIGQHKAQCLFKKDTRSFYGMAVKHSMRQTNGLVFRNGCVVGSLGIAMHNFNSATIWIANDNDSSAGRI